MIRAQEAPMAHHFQRRKSNVRLTEKFHTASDRKRVDVLPRPYSSSNTVCDTNTAVKTEIRRPMISVTAKPLTGPVPNWKRKIAEMTTVMCVSMIVANAFEKPFSIAVFGARPPRSSSRMRSKMSTFESTAMPIVRMKPAIPGSVSVALKSDMAPRSRIAFRIRASTAFHPARR